jgi:transaldolase
MKIFLDTADIQAIKQWSQTGLIDGVTTNPTHLSKAGGNPTQIVKEICALLPEGEISVEITEQDPEAVYQQAREIAAIAQNVLVKIPCHARYYEMINRLQHDGIPMNITLVFSLEQGLMMCKLAVDYISPFVGRLDDIQVNGAELLYELCAMRDEYDFDTGILAASIRHTRHFHEAILAGVDAITVPINVLEEVMHQGIEKFNADWAKLGIRKFP